MEILQTTLRKRRDSSRKMLNLRTTSKTWNIASWVWIFIESFKILVLGLGDSNYSTYQGFPNKLDKILQDFGAERVLKKGEADDQVGYENLFERFLNIPFFEISQFSKKWKGKTTNEEMARKNIQLSSISFFRLVSLVYSYVITRDVLIFKNFNFETLNSRLQFFHVSSGDLSKEGICNPISIHRWSPVQTYLSLCLIDALEF